NLISNAIKYGDEKQITVGVFTENNQAVIRVKDQGIGIPEDKKELIFQRFERAVSAKNYKGLGVGLFISNHIVQAHGGKIEVVSNTDQGSEFIVRLPLQMLLPKPVELLSNQ